MFITVNNENVKGAVGFLPVWFPKIFPLGIVKVVAVLTGGHSDVSVASDVRDSLHLDLRTLPVSCWVRRDSA